MSPEEVAKVLNRLLKADPVAMNSLLRGVPCNEVFANDPDVVVSSKDGVNGPFDVSSLGLINGLMGFRKDTVVAVFKTDGGTPWELVGFKAKD